MTNQEINESVARKIGHEIIEDGGELFIRVSAERLAGGDIREGYKRIPDYCHSIKAAWQIVEYIRYWTLTRLRYGPWECRLFDNDSYFAEADSAPKAICLAFLKIGEK